MSEKGAQTGLWPLTDTALLFLQTGFACVMYVRLSHILTPPNATSPFPTHTYTTTTTTTTSKHAHTQVEGRGQGDPLLAALGSSLVQFGINVNSAQQENDDGQVFSVFKVTTKEGKQVPQVGVYFSPCADCVCCEAGSVVADFGVDIALPTGQQHVANNHLLGAMLCHMFVVLAASRCLVHWLSLPPPLAKFNTNAFIPTRRTNGML